jgi:phospholipase/lecithinase/hemolysin
MMKSKLLTAGLLFFSCLMPIPASATGFSQIYAFGDSLVDNGNAYQYTGGAIPPFPYFQGRFSNGPVWVEYLANSLEIPTTNYAIGGATTGIFNTLIPSNPTALPGLTQQIQGFVNTNQQADGQALYIIWAGANDYLPFGIQKDANQSVSNLTNAVQLLAQKGARNFLIPNLPDLGELPGTRSRVDVDELTDISQQHNFLLNQAITALNQQQPDIKITGLDIYSLVNQALASPSDFGYTNVTDACFVGAIPSLCSQPNQYFFWDEIHPTTYTHQIVAGAALRAVPESFGVWGILALGAVATTGKLKKRISKLATIPANQVLDE